MSLHTDAIMDAIVAAVKAAPPDGGVASYPETFPLVGFDKISLPALFLGLDRVEIAPGEATLRGQEQHYAFDLIYVMSNGSQQYPRQVARQRAEQIVDALEAAPTLGITDFEVGEAYVGLVQSDNAVQRWLLDTKTACTAVWLSFEVLVSE